MGDGGEAVVSALLGLLLAAGADFETCGERDGVSIASRSVPGSGFVELRFTVETIGDVETMCRAAYGSGKVEPGEPHVNLRQILKESADTRVTYEQIAPPMISPRDYVLSSTRSYPSPGSCRVDFVSTDDAPRRPGLVRLKHLAGSFLFQSLGGGRVRLEHRIHMDPGGALAPFVVEPSRERLGVEWVRRLVRL
jgi:hypothetical protein